MTTEMLHNQLGETIVCTAPSVQTDNLAENESVAAERFGR
jgi:hypothetical protein